jgi:hypothetical protein
MQGLGYDLLSTADNSIRTNVLYKYDQSIISFYSSSMAAYTLADLSFLTIQLKGLSSGTSIS